MTADDLAVVVRGMTPVVREYVASQIDPLLKTIAVLEQRLAVAEQRPLTPGPPGKNAEPVDVEALARKAADLVPTPEVTVPEIDVEGIAKAAAALVPKPENGKDAEPVDLEALAKQAASLIPKPENGKDAQVDLQALARKAAELVPAPENGKDGEDGKVDEAMLTALVEQHVTKAIQALPRPENGRSVTVEDVAPLIVSEVQKAVSAIPPAKDGVGVVDTLQDRDGHLRIVLSDGQTKDVGKIAGRDGEDGKSIDPAVVKAMIVEEVAKIPPPKDGKDGAGFPDMETSEDEFGRPTLVWPNGKSVRLPSIIDRGVWRQDNTYLKWDGVSYGGSFFIAQVEHPTSAPETNSKEWRLAVKRGRDGKGEKGNPGEPGQPGKDFTLPASVTKGRY